ncbi:cytochrome P450 [Thelephora ganbajun]|uniref:Cytochrome P450 n=1 Tax=Thelephora ganbajun TaxID=370292 RepID=A0ACB6ZGE3_THEGA|nr:cytochrome P450 [Thelephora ganbajun]
MMDTFAELFEECKATTINLRILWVDKYITMDSGHIKYIYNSGFSKFWRGHTQKEMTECFLGSGILNRDDEEWKTHRMIARPFFATDRVSDLDLFERNAQKVIDIMLNADPKGSLDLEDLFARLTVDTASEFLFGENLNTLSYTNDGFRSFTNAFMDIQALIRRRNLLGNFWPLLELFKDQSEGHKKVIRGWVDPLVVRAVQIQKEMKEKGQTVNPDECTFLEYLATTTQDVDVLRDQLLNILLAARDTTTALLSHVIYLFAVHPDVLKKAREEILELIGSEGVLTAENMRGLKYLRAVLNETMRLFTPLPMSIRDTRDSGVTLPRSDATYDSPPMYMPPKTPILFVFYLMQRNKALWGSDAEEFKPDRWFDPELQQKVSSNPAIFTPFASGPRNCLGQNYALNEATLFLVRLLQRFDEFAIDERKQLPPPWKKDPNVDTGLKNPRSGTSRKEIERIWPAFAIVIHINGGLWIRFKKASE